MALYKPSDQTVETQRMIDTIMKTQEEGDEKEEEEEEEEELEKLEVEVMQMAERILHFRTTLPDQIKEAFTVLASSTMKLRPDNPISTAPSSDHGGSSQFGEGTSSVNRDNMITEKLKMLRENTSRNASQIPVLLKRMKHCISMMEKSNLHNFNIHPVFKETSSSLI